MNDDQTIYAPASAAGRAGVAVFRVSGRDAFKVFESLCAPSDKPEPRQACLRKIKNPETGDLVDQALVIAFKAPHSFTGEDVVEVHTHGGRAVTQAMIEALATLPRFRMAEPGEFTRRAFENGKMDLTEAEAVADLVHAETEAQRKQALRQMEGMLGKLYEDWRRRLGHSLAMMEAAIDFADEDLPENLAEEQRTELENLRDAIARHLDDNHRGERLRDGFSIVLLGPPNAGKSSLLNALARRDAAIVSPLAGTTRDVIEVHLDIKGYPIVLADTAGLREEEFPQTESIELEGIRRARMRAAQADLKIMVFDGELWPQLGASAEELIDKDTLVTVNKKDLIQDLRSSGWDKIARQCKDLNPEGPLFLSVKTGEGIDALLEKVGNEIDRRYADRGSAPLTRARHREALTACLDNLTRALQATQADLRAEDVRLAVRSLGRITGRVDVEDLLDMIFRDFCIGK